MTGIDKVEFNQVVDEYINHPKVLELKNYQHHGVNRYDHSYRVAYYTYKTTKLLNINYISATKAAMLHDFFFDEVKEKSAINRYRLHPIYAVKNSKKYFTLTPLEENIIKRHMFPITLLPPKYLESWIVDIIDDIISIYEKCHSITQNLKIIASNIKQYAISFIR